MALLAAVTLFVALSEGLGFVLLAPMLGALGGIAESGVPGPSPRAPEIHCAESAAKIRRACRIARKILDLAGKVCHMS